MIIPRASARGEPEINVKPRRRRQQVLRQVRPPTGAIIRDRHVVPQSLNLLNWFCVTRGFVSTRTDGPPSTTTGAKMGPVGVTLSWKEAHPGARASPAQILPQLRPSPPPESTGAAPCLCFGRAHAVPAGRAVGCNIAGKLSGNRRDSMRAGRPRSRGCRPDGEVGGIRRATSLKAGLSPLGNSRLPASRAPAPRDWADPSRRTEHRCTGCTG